MDLGTNQNHAGWFFHKMSTSDWLPAAEGNHHESAPWRCRLLRRENDGAPWLLTSRCVYISSVDDKYSYRRVVGQLFFLRRRTQRLPIRANENGNTTNKVRQRLSRAAEWINKQTARSHKNVGNARLVRLRRQIDPPWGGLSGSCRQRSSMRVVESSKWSNHMNVVL